MRKRFAAWFILLLVVFATGVFFYYVGFRDRNQLLDNWYSGYNNVRLEGVRFINSDGRTVTLLEPTLISARSVNRLVTFSALLSIDFYHICLLLATLSQFWRSASLYCFESSVDN